MQRVRTRGLVAVTAAVASAAAVFAAPASAQSAKPSSIPIVSIVPLSGPVGPTGKQLVMGIQGMLGALNAKGGIQGAKFDYATQDDQYTPTKTKSLVQQAISGRKRFMIGEINNTGITAALPDLNAAKFLVVAGVGSDVTLDYTSPTIYSPAVPCAYWKMGAYQYLHDTKKITKFASIQLNSPTFIQCDTAVNPALQKIGASNVSTQPISVGAADCTAQAVNAMSAGAQAVGIYADNLSFQHCVQALKQQGFAGPIVASQNVIDTPSVLQSLGRESDGIVAASPQVLLSSNEYKSVCARAVGKYSNNDTQPGGYTVEGCVGVLMVTQALKALGPNATGEQIAKYFDTHVISTKGLTPPLHFGFNPTLPHLPFDKVQIVQVKDGEWHSVRGFFTANVSPKPQSG